MTPEQQCTDCDHLVDVLLRTALYITNNPRLEHRIFRACAIHGIACELTRAAKYLQEYTDLRRREFHNHDTFYFDR